MKTISTIAASLSIVGAFYLSAPPAYAGPVEDRYDRASPCEQTKAICEVHAGTQGAGAAAGTLIGGILGHARAYDQCMVASGYVHNN
jgi:hypothetical protein